MLYREPLPKRTWWILPLLFFLLLYLPFLGLRELRTDEAQMLSIGESLSSGWFQANLHGQPVDAFPLVPWLMRLVAETGLPAEWCARLPAALAVLGLAALAGRVAGLAGGHLAGAMAATMCVSVFGLLGISQRAPVEPVGAFFIAAAWFVWYRFWRVRHQWGTAWACGIGLATLGYFCVGMKAFLIFYFPLLLLRRPLRVWPRIFSWGHFLGAGTAAILVWGWYAGQPGNREALLPREVNVAGFVEHLVQFPLTLSWLLLPWTMLLWPAFCSAFRPMERTPVQCGFLRQLVLPVMLAAWLLPDARPADLLPLLVPLAVLTGIHADILLRRHAGLLFRMTEWFFRAGLVLAILILAILATTTVSWVRIDHFSVGLQFTCLAAAMAAMLIGLWWLRQPTVAPYRVQLPLSVACLAFAIQSFYPAARILTHETRREAGAELNQNLPPDTTVYLLPDPDAPLAVELIYLHETVKRIDSPAELPEERLELYVLAGAKPPILETRAWQEVSPLVPIRQEPVIHWDWLPKGGGLLRLERTFDGTDRGVGVARVYRGTLKTLPQAPLLPPLPPPSPTATP